jgi:hypothetical protein
MKQNLVFILLMTLVMCSCKKHIDYDQFRTKNSDAYETIEFNKEPIGFKSYINTDPDFIISVPNNYVMSVLANRKEARIFQFKKEYQIIQINIIDMYSLTHAISVGRKKYSYNDYVVSEMNTAFNEYTKRFSEGKGDSSLDIQERAIKRLGKNTLIYIRYNQPETNNEYTNVQYNFLNEGYAITIVGVFDSNKQKDYEVVQAMNSFSF